MPKDSREAAKSMQYAASVYAAASAANSRGALWYRALMQCYEELHAKVCLVEPRDLLCGSRRQKETAKPMVIKRICTDFFESESEATNRNRRDADQAACLFLRSVIQTAWSLA
jgi:hypothetical protein